MSGWHRRRTWRNAICGWRRWCHPTTAVSAPVRVVDWVWTWVIHLCLQFNTASGLPAARLIPSPWKKSFRIIIHKLCAPSASGSIQGECPEIFGELVNARPLHLFYIYCLDILTNPAKYWNILVNVMLHVARRRILFHQIATLTSYI